MFPRKTNLVRKPSNGGWGDGNDLLAEVLLLTPALQSPAPAEAVQPHAVRRGCSAPLKNHHRGKISFVEGRIYLQNAMLWKGLPAGCGEPVFSPLEQSTGFKKKIEINITSLFRRGLLRCEAGQVTGTAEPGAHRQAQAMLQLGEGAWGDRGGLSGDGAKIAQSPCFSLISCSSAVRAQLLCSTACGWLCLSSATPLA